MTKRLKGQQGRHFLTQNSAATAVPVYVVSDINISYSIAFCFFVIKSERPNFFIALKQITTQRLQLKYCYGFSSQHRAYLRGGSALRFFLHIKFCIANKKIFGLLSRAFSSNIHFAFSLSN